MNFEFSGPYFLSFLLRNFISKHTPLSWLLANRLFPTLQVLFSFAVTGVLQLPCNSHFCAPRSHDGQSSRLAPRGRVLSLHKPRAASEANNPWVLARREEQMPWVLCLPKPEFEKQLFPSCWQPMESINTTLTQLWSKAESSGRAELFVLSG